MKICIIGGGGAIGGFLAVQLARAGNDVTVVARGVTYEAIKKNGLKLITDEFPEGVTGDVRLLDRVVDAGIQDLVILTMKAHQLAPIAEFLPHVIGPDTVVVPMQNGIPYWYFQRHGGEYENRIVEIVDPHGVIMKAIDPRNVLGCVVYPAAITAAPGVIKHIEGIRFPIGELDGTTTERAQKISETFIAAGQLA